ncbi:site-specific DNA-methyltransferase [Winogradskyella helgolandensis]|uniref:site-specific DNA-methyltransferase n=1 Tax=Winogradskyella helgolandensis TaxID=2697010 RepID=UPI0015B86508|nr:site-specific DNA-methyltransferase [Winogradskyella helgolandensis]
MSIERINKGDNLSQSENIVETNIDKLKTLFPEIVTEGKIDFKVLQEVLGNELEEGEEYYRFTWAGKANARREAQKPSTGTLRPAPEESVDWDTTQNLYIEGDNLEVLKLLQKSYAGKVKMIYIDPPYNTGKDFVYKDNYKDNLRNYQEVTGQLDEEGNKLSTNSDSDGRYHSNWLNMMYPRLRLARNLLKDDGVIYISLDDNEIENLKQICREIFGEENFISQMALVNNIAGRSDSKDIAIAHEYILMYQKTNQYLSYGVDLTEKQLGEYKHEDDIGKYRLQGLRKRGSNSRRQDRPNMFYPVFYGINDNIISTSRKSEDDVEILPKLSDGSDGCWRWGKDTLEKKIHLLEVNIVRTRNEYDLFEKVYLNSDEGKKTRKLKSYLLDSKYTSDYATSDFKKIMPAKIFNSPKSVQLISDLVKNSSKESDIILDFFSGSASSGQAIMEINIADNQNRKFIQVQLPELTDSKSEAHKNGYDKITDIGKERIRRAAKKIAEENPEKAKNLDLGFKVFKLDTSNIKGWDGNPANLDESLFDAQDNIKTDRSERDVLYEILLKYGLDLTLPIEEKKIESKTVFSVGYGALFICLADNITNKVAQGIGEWKEELAPEVCRVVFKDSGFTDVEKTNSVQTLKRFGITEIKSI